MIVIKEQKILTSCCIYSHIRSFTACVLASALIALSISLMIPSCGGGRCPDRIMLAVVTDVSGPRSGEEDMTV